MPQAVFLACGMFASLLNDIVNWRSLLQNPATIIITAFMLWMFIHAVRQREWVWALFILIGFGIAAVWYYFAVYRASGSSMRGFELPGAENRKRIKELQAQIHHLDKAHHHSQLGDVYFRQGKLEKAEVSYRDALARDAQDIDTRAHLGQCLLRQKRAAEAKPLLEGVVSENAKHDYGYTLMALAETYTALGETDAALKVWLQVTGNNSYPRAKVQLAQLYMSRNQNDLARAELQDVVQDDPHAPSFQRRRDRVWVRRAKGLLSKLPR